MLNVSRKVRLLDYDSRAVPTNIENNTAVALRNFQAWKLEEGQKKPITVLLNL